MRNNNKNYKFTNGIKRIGPKLRWFLFTEIQDMKLTSDYIDFICPGSDKKTYQDSNPIENLKNLIEQALIREFSEKIRNLKSFDLLVDEIMYHIQKKALNDDNELERILAD